MYKRLQAMREVYDLFSNEDKCSLIYLLIVFPSQFMNIYKLIELKCNEYKTRGIFFIFLMLKILNLMQLSMPKYEIFHLIPFIM